MKIFRCDICLSPFEPKGNEKINTVEFMYSDIDDSDYNSKIKFSDVDVRMPTSCSGLNCFYHICPKCVNVLRDTIWSLRNKYASEEADQNE